ncbi:catalase family peroxidase [Bosea sp. SSUT16]|uniref:Catalase-related peroxidase n=1 Tax=Bosea spartocytisi TaxID=2773451 RepID=A0A927EDC7_9HYPH|nr:catalase family peroxidase [Bosea spartocytisi]MBD3848867.1 catalase family peroxidase [Bosea spartocytisi]
MRYTKKLALLIAPLAALAFSGSGAWAQSTSPAPSASDAPLAEQLVNALNSAFGQHPDTRAVHAKGIVLTGEFVPSSAAQTVSKADFLQKDTGQIPITVRFSNFAGLLDVADNDPNLASPRGMAIKFEMKDGSSADIVSHSVNGFPAKTGAEFRDLFFAIGASGPNAQKPTPLDKFLDGHPAAKTFLTSVKPAPASYGTLPYFGVNAFKFTNARGDAVYGRYQIVPIAGEHYLTDDQRAKSAEDYLHSEMAERLKSGPVKFRLLLQIANAGDPIADPTRPWPDSRKLINLGEIQVSKLAPDSLVAQRDLLFVPDNVPDGIEPADPMISERSGAYAVSYGRRHQ